MSGAPIIFNCATAAIGTAPLAALVELVVVLEVLLLELRTEALEFDELDKTEPEEDIPWLLELPEERVDAAAEPTPEVEETAY